MKVIMDHFMDFFCFYSSRFFKRFFPTVFPALWLCLSGTILGLFFAGCQERQETQSKDGNSTSEPEGPLSEDLPFPTPGLQEELPLGAAKDTSPTRMLKGLILATVDPLAMPWKASIYAFNSETETAEKILSGESGDPIFRSIKDDIWLINRSSDSQNLRMIKSPLTPERSVGNQQKFVGGAVGDPHDALRLGKNVLFAHYTEGQLALMDKDTFEARGLISAEWDLPEGVKLKPSALIYAFDENSKKSFVYVVHQALSIKSGVYGVNNTQQVFVLSFDPNNSDTPLSPLDLDPAQPKIQGIKLKGSFPVPLKLGSKKRLILVSMCSRFSLMNPADGPTCQSAVEEIKIADHTSQVLWDMNQLSPTYYMNGSVISDQGSSFFANVERQETPGNFVQKIAKFNFETKEISEIYQFKQYSGGFWASFFDPSSQKFYVGDLGSNGSIGHLLIIDPKTPNKILKEVPLEGVPYSGTWVLAP